MTDNDIIKALEIFDKFDFFQGQREGRELWNDKPADVQNEDIDNFKKDVAFLKDFINRQKAESEKQDAEIGRLKGILESYALQYGTVVNKEFFLRKARTEAVKEFAEKLKKKSYPFPCAIGVEHAVTLRAINDLLKEFEEKNAK